jgi:hypothetical protein
VYTNTFEAFQQLKEVLHELANEINEELPATDKRTKLEYRDRGHYEAEIRVASDTLVFHMHSNVFQFDRTHSAWDLDYVKQDATNAYCGMVNIYNFLADSFRLCRIEDEGYLIGRIFVNRNNHFFVEGKRQETFAYSHFGEHLIGKDSIRQVAETAILYALNFDLLVPSYDMAKTVTVGQINNKTEDSKLQTGKRLGYQFCSDDVDGDMRLPF